MEKLKYVVEDRTIAELLGIQNFTNKEAAILELVKNAYDAQAKNIYISIDKEKIVIEDDGIGMDENTIRQNWMHVGKSEKGYRVLGKNNNDNRILAGSKGVGRFALARLGGFVRLYSMMENSRPIKWETDWEESIFENWGSSESGKSKTVIEISLLRDNWTKKSIDNLIRYLSVTYNDSKMKINIMPNSGKNVAYVFKKPEIGINFTSKLTLDYKADSRNILYSIESDEFTLEAEKYCTNIDLKKYKSSISVLDELSGDSDLDIDKENLNKLLGLLGDFSCELYFSLKSSTKKDSLNFCYKHISLEDRYDYGIVLYRNAFSISSFEGIKDWLELGKRSRKSPAAATHPTGSWKVRENQVSGRVHIDKEKNKYLTDIANRQGIEENEYYKLFTKIIIIGISAFERYRQSIIRTINKKNLVESEVYTPIIEQLRKGSKKNVNSYEVKKLLEEINLFIEEISNYKRQQYSTEKQYSYDVRILNVLATMGLKASSIAHEFKNDRNTINSNYYHIVHSLKKYDLWEELNSAECTRYAHSNIPNLLERNREINGKIVSFMNTMLNEIEKKRFSPRKLSVFEILSKIKDNWLRDYSTLIINIDVDENLHFDTAEDVFNVIFDNLILNSWQQNQSSNRVEIDISALLIGDRLVMHYSDNGVGLSPKYINDPMRILSVHESTRVNGHGLGMWILNNTVQMTGGEVLEIDGHQGFNIKFELGGKI